MQVLRACILHHFHAKPSPHSGTHVAVGHDTELAKQSSMSESGWALTAECLSVAAVLDQEAVLVVSAACRAASHRKDISPRSCLTRAGAGQARARRAKAATRLAELQRDIAHMEQLSPDQVAAEDSATRQLLEARAVPACHVPAQCPPRTYQ